MFISRHFSWYFSIISGVESISPFTIKIASKRLKSIVCDIKESKSLKDNFSDCKKIVSTDNKEIYDSSKYKIIATTEFDY